MSGLTRCNGIILKNNSCASQFIMRFMISRCKTTAISSSKEEYDPDTPIKFSTSGAGWNYKNIAAIHSSNINTPWYKEVILWGTFFFFLNYFMFFRPANEIDEELEMPLGQRYLWVQELHLLDEKNKLLSGGNSASTVDEELEKINQLRKKYNYV